MCRHFRCLPSVKQQNLKESSGTLAHYCLPSTSMYARICCCCARQAGPSHPVSYRSSKNGNGRGRSSKQFGARAGSGTCASVRVGLWCGISGAQLKPTIPARQQRERPRWARTIVRASLQRLKPASLGVRAIRLPQQRLISIVCIGSVIALWVASNALWACRDTTPPSYDPAKYLHLSLGQFRVLRDPTLPLSKLMSASLSGRPPLYTLIAQPLYLIGTTSEDVVTVATNSVFIVILVISIFLIGKDLFDARTGLLAAALLPGYPMLTIFSRSYRPHFGAAAMVALGACVLFKTRHFRSTGFGLLFGLTVAIGMLTSAYVAVGLLGLSVWFAARSLLLAYRATSPNGRYDNLLKVSRNIILALLIVLAVAVPWYVVHAEDMFAILEETQTSKTFAPVRDVMSWSSLLWYLLNIHRTVSPVLVPAFVVGAAFALLRRQRSATTLLLWLGGSYLPLSLMATKTPMHSMIMVPSVALLSAHWIPQVRQRAVRLLLVGLLIVASIVLFVETAWHPLRPADTASLLGVRAAPPASGNWHIGDILETVEANAVADSPSILVVADVWYYHPEGFGYEAARRGLRSKLYSCRNADPARLLQTEYIVTLVLPEGESMTGIWGVTPCHTWNALLENPPEPFTATHTLLGSFPLPNGSEARIYKQTRPPTYAESVELLEKTMQLNTLLRHPRDENACYALLELVGGQRSTGNSLGDVVTLLGHSIQPISGRAGEEVELSVCWQALATMDTDYTAFIHVVGQDGRLWAQQDTLLLVGENPTSLWREGWVLYETYELQLPSDMPAGDYTIKAGLYFWQTGERLPAWDGEGHRLPDDAVPVETITLQAGNCGEG